MVLTSHSCNSSFIFSCLFLPVRSRVAAWTGLVSPVTAVWWWWLVQGTVVQVVLVLVYQAQSALVSGPVHIVTVTVTTFCFRCVTTGENGRGGSNKTAAG